MALGLRRLAGVGVFGGSGEVKGWDEVFLGFC